MFASFRFPVRLYMYVSTGCFIQVSFSAELFIRQGTYTIELRDEMGTLYVYSFDKLYIYILTYLLNSLLIYLVTYLLTYLLKNKKKSCRKTGSWGFVIFSELPYRSAEL